MFGRREKDLRRRTLHDFYFTYFLPKVMVKFNEKGLGTLCDAYLGIHGCDRLFSIF